MKEKSRAVLKKAIAEMPTHKLENRNFWEIFDNRQYDADKNHYANIIGNLPVFDAPEELWERLERELDKIPDKRQLRIVNYLQRVAAAASILLLAGVGLIYINHKYETRYSHATSIIAKTKAIPKDDLDIMPIWNPSLCESNPRICNTVLFKSLDKQLIDVKDELLLMKPMVRNNDPQMMKYYLRLVNLRVEIEKKMIKIIMES